MAKWTSPILSDLRGQVAKMSVFSSWKGRRYFRSYAIPANPNTNKQRVQRGRMVFGVGLWQSNIKGDATKEAEWDKAGEVFLLPGFNFFLKEGLTCDIEVTGTGSGTLTVHYVTKMSVDRVGLAIYNLTDEVWVTGKTVATGATVGDYTFTGLEGGKTYRPFVIDYGIYSQLSSEREKGAALCYWHGDDDTGNVTAQSGTPS